MAEPAAGPAISVIVPAYNASATLDAALDALEAQDYPGEYEVIVVDDGSDDGTAELAESRSGLTVLRAEHAGPAAARNLGVSRSRAPLLAFTDADCAPPPDWLAAGTEALAGFDLAQGAVAPDPGEPPGPFDHTLWVVGESGLYETASLFVRRDAFDRAGGFTDPLGARLGKQLAEDVWLGWRIRRAGETTFIDDAVVRHAVLPRSPLRFVAERFRQWYFPAIARFVPELRRTLFFGRLFLSSRTAAFDAALTGAVLAAVLGTYPLLVLVAPYAAIHLRRARGRGLQAPHVGAVEALADLVGLAGLLAGSIRFRRLVL